MNWNKYQENAVATLRMDDIELTVEEDIQLRACLQLQLNISRLIRKLELDSRFQVGRDHFTIIGLIGEAGEFIDLVKKIIFHKQVVSEERIIDEAGDVVWYIATTAYVLGYSMGSLAKPVDEAAGYLLGCLNSVRVITQFQDVYMQDVLEANVSKLRKDRYPDGFKFGGGADR